MYYINRKMIQLSDKSQKFLSFESFSNPQWSLKITNPSFHMEQCSVSHMFAASAYSLEAIYTGWVIQVSV